MLEWRFQNPVLLEWRSILKNVMLPLEIVPTKLSRRQQEDRARKLLALVGLRRFRGQASFRAFRAACVNGLRCAVRWFINQKC